ncbi:MAG: oxidoreductase-like domain-containing protein [Conchiformibius sp.]|nr:oxidoreductase-like domain-containing protein [Conchiformibius sp.]
MAMNPQPEPLNPPEPPQDWECCGSECGDACIFEIYRRELEAYRQRLREADRLPETRQTAD